MHACTVQGGAAVTGTLTRTLRCAAALATPPTAQKFMPSHFGVTEELCLLQKIAEHCQVYAPDLRFHGDSDKPKWVGDPN